MRKIGERVKKEEKKSLQSTNRIGYKLRQHLLRGTYFDGRHVKKQHKSEG